jgi:signal transduction histidine kinase
MAIPHTDPPPGPEAEAALKSALESWDKQRLLDFALRTAQALSKEKGTVKSLVDRHYVTQNWALGLALVEEIGQNLASTLDLNEVLTRLLARTYQAVEVEDGSIMLIEEPSGDLVAQVVLGSLSEEVKSFRVPKGQGIAGEIATTGQPVVVNDAKNDPRHFSQIDKDTGFETRSILGVPILSQDKVIGVLEVFNKKSGSSTKQDQVLLSSIANYAGIAIENARLHQSVVAERDRVLRVQEEVSHKLQRNLHDGPTQLVAALQMSIDFCQQAIEHQEPGMALTELSNMHELAMRATHQMRTLLFELRPLILETQGLVPALTIFLERRQIEAEPTKLQLKISSDRPGGKINRLAGKIGAALFAIVQEAVTNAMKHAQASAITVALTQVGEQLTVTISDDGQGFDVSKTLQNYDERGSYGMVNLRERVAVVNGEYTITSEIGKGTEVRVVVPVG